MGAKGVRIEEPGDVREGLKEALAYKESTLDRRSSERRELSLVGSTAAGDAGSILSHTIKTVSSQLRGRAACCLRVGTSRPALE